LLHGIDVHCTTFDHKLKAQSHFITLSIRSTPLQFVDGRFFLWIKHPQKEERERERYDKQIDKASGRRANKVKQVVDKP
jgi:hypothetical protein